MNIRSSILLALALSLGTFSEAIADENKRSCRADLWFANDESGSINDSEFDGALDFLYQLSDRFNFDDNTGVKAGITQWSYSSRNVIIPITQHFSDSGDTGLKSDNSLVITTNGLGIRELYDQRFYKNGGTNLLKATEHLYQLLSNTTTPQDPNNHGRRASVQQVVVILTDARSSQITNNSAAWINSSNDLRQAAVPDNVAIIMVLIDDAKAAYENSPNVRNIINEVVGGNEQLVLKVDNYADASDPTQHHINTLVDVICDVASNGPDESPRDWGDAPDSYGTDGVAANSGNDEIGASHKIVKGLFLGDTAPDQEAQGQPGDGAYKDGWEEDGVAVPNILISNSTYTIPASDITVTNALAEPATLYGFVDFNRDGDFNDVGESAKTTVNSGATHPTSDLVFQSFESASSPGKTYSRFRISRDKQLTATGKASDGEVEDYDMNVIAYDPCCPPWSVATINELFEYASPGPLSSDYSVQINQAAFQPFSARMQAYIDFLHTTDPSINKVTIQMEIFERGNGIEPQFGWPSSSQVGASVVNSWVTGNAANTNANNFPLEAMQVNRWYGLKTGIYLNNRIQYFPRKCAENNVYVRLETRNSLRSEKPERLLKFSYDGKSTSKTVVIRGDAR